MSTYQGTYSSLLGGVSQQVDTARLPNQCTEQINMICDPVWGLRRRPSTYATPTLFDSIPKERIKQVKTGLLQMGDNAMAPRTLNPQAGKVFVYPQDKALATAQREAIARRLAATSP